MTIQRFDDRDVLTSIILELRGQGADLDYLDVQLSLLGPVDLDLLRECLADAARATLPHEELDTAIAA